MRNPILFALLTWAGSTLVAWGAPIRYKDDVFQNITLTSDIQYGSSKSHTGATENQLLDVYQPQGDTAKARPLLIFIHGGGFSAGNKTDGDIVFLCRTFAKKGYVTVSITYRLQGALTTYSEMIHASYRAVQDGKAAVRFLRAHRADYGIDDTRILMGGTSAGGVMSLLHAYLDEAEVSPLIDTASLGGLEGSGGTPGVSSAIHGIINCWGGVGDSAIVYNAKLPALSFHGMSDPTVPYDIGYSLGIPALVTFGSACIHRNLARANVQNTLRTFVGMGHGMPPGDARIDTLVAMTTEFAYGVLFPTTPVGIRPLSGSANPSSTWILNRGKGGPIQVNGRAAKTRPGK